MHRREKEKTEHLAGAVLAEVVRVRVTSEEPDERVQLSDSILQRGSRQAPLVLALEVETRLGNVGRSVLDVVGLVEDDAVPVDLMGERLLADDLAALLGAFRLLGPAALQGAVPVQRRQRGYTTSAIEVRRP